MSLSRKDIIEYKTTNDNSRKNEIEMSVIDNEFDRDALDGWSDNQVAITQFKSLDNKIKIKGWLKLILPSVIITSGSIVALFIYLNSSESNENKLVETKKPSKPINTTISKDSISSFTELPTKMQIKPSKIKSDFEEKKLFQTNENSNQNELNRESLRLPIKNVDKINNAISKRENLAKETFLNDLKVIDYRIYRIRPIEQKINELGGTPADREKNYNESTNKENSIEYTYYSYLDKTLKYFNKNKFRIALNRFETILETYPDDANALFYGAICLFNLNQFELCENRLTQLENNRFTNFDQEKQWYLLLVYKSLDNKNSFEMLKEKIILENGFYSKSAKILEF